MTVHKKPVLITIQKHGDHRGTVNVLEDPALPFRVKRIFWLSQVPDHTHRGGHAHYQSEQILVCTYGSVKVMLEDLSSNFYHFELDSPGQGLFLPPLHWGIYRFEDQARAFCLASDCYNEEDYIRDYQLFQRLKNVFQNH